MTLEASSYLIKLTLPELLELTKDKGLDVPVEDLMIEDITYDSDIITVELSKVRS